jgi:exosortase
MEILTEDAMTLAEGLRNYRIQLALLLPLFVLMYYNIVPMMVSQWYDDPNYSHGFIVPVIAGYFLYERREELFKAEVSPANAGLLIIIFGLLQLCVGYLAFELYTMRSSFIVILAGMILYFFGSAVFRIMLLPVLYLFFMVPLPYIVYDSVAFPLKQFVAKYSVAILQLLGVVIIREGNVLLLPETTLEVADACSGIRSLVSLLALATAFAVFSQKSTIKRVIMIISAIPIAIFTNGLRVIGTGILAQYWGSKAAEGFFHEFAGLAVFAVALLMLAGLGTIMSKVGK